MRRVVVIPAIVIGCLIVVWVGTVAASNMPSDESLSPTMTAVAKSNLSKQEDLHQTEIASACSLSERYPTDVTRWCELIEQSAVENGLPAGLIAAVILQESGGNPESYSSSGAVGLMQIMPRDGIASEFMCINGPCFASRPTIEELQDPSFNIKYGSHMLAELYAKHGSYREALFRYGPMDIGYHYADLVLRIWKNY